MIDREYSRLTDLGRLFGVSSHVTGKRLAELDLRTVGGHPTAKARDLGLVTAVSTDRGDGKHEFFVWHTAKTVKLRVLPASVHESI